MNRTFIQIYPSNTDFITNFRNNPLNTTELTDDDLTFFYVTLYGKYGNEQIAPKDESQFEYRMYTILRASGVSLKRAISIQAEMRAKDVDDMLLGGSVTHNIAGNSDQEHSNDSEEGLAGTSTQTKTINKRSWIDAALTMYDANNDIGKLVDAFLIKFAPLFLPIKQTLVDQFYIMGGF